MCGITALISNNGDNIIYDLYESLYHLQHRGQDAFGLSFMNSNNNNSLEHIKRKSLLSSTNINNEIQDIHSCAGLGHVRYPTQGSNTINECQPFFKEASKHNISLVHNGQIWITDKLIRYFNNNNINIDPEITSDSIYLLEFLSYNLNKYNEINYIVLLDIVYELYNLFEGSYNCICMIENYGLFCFKDIHSIRPLILGKKDKNNFIISSESVSITSLNYDIIEDILGNELYIFKNKYFTKLNIKYSNTNIKPCIFEWVYLAREESIMYGVNVYQSRLKMGEYLAHKIIRNINIDMIDMVIPVPDTSKPVALQISNILNKPYYEAITKNRYINRTFIMDSQNKRRKNIKRKLNVVKEIIYKKNILIVDDSVVRGNTIKHIIELLKSNNVKKIFVASSSPEIINTNRYGIDIPDRNDLICFNKDNSTIEKELGINKIIFQDIDDLKKSIQYFNKSLIDFEMSIYKFEI